MTLGALADTCFWTECFERLDSSQDAALRRLERGEEVHGLVIRAGAQSGGRGRRGRRWASPPGGSYQSLALRDPAPPSLRRGLVPLALAVGLADTLTARGVACGVKWPNDLYLRGAKLAGLLADYRRDHLVVGVGVNVTNPVPEGATGLVDWHLETVHALVLEGLRAGFGLLERGENIPARFARHDLLLGQAVRARLGGEVLGATARGITDQGCLRLELKDGRRHDLCNSGLEGFGLRKNGARVG